MGNTQDRPQSGRREAKSDSLSAAPVRGGGARVTGSSEEEFPVQMRIRQAEPSVEQSACVFPVVLKWSRSAGDGRPPLSVQVSGSWDGWQRKIPLVPSQEDFSTIVNLREGRHELKFLVDGRWQADANMAKTSNEMGGENNVLTIDKADFEVFDALDRDLQESGAAAADLRKSGSGGSQSSDDKRLAERSQLAFGQEMPERDELDHAPKPPVLPPHLLQVILNKDTPVQCDPNVLPEPNHVMLNHLYALSIKDGVMVLSATHRYRKKYVTTLLYKPI